MTTLLDVPWSNFCAFVKVKINQKNAKQTNAARKKMRRGERRKRSTQRVNDKFSLAFWQLVFSFFFYVIFGLVLLLFFFLFTDFLSTKKKCFMQSQAKLMSNVTQFAAGRPRFWLD